MRRHLTKNKKGLMDEFADDLFAFFILGFTFLAILLIYQASAGDNLQFYRTESITLANSRLLNDFASQELTEGLTMAEILTNTKLEDTEDYVEAIANSYFRAKIGKDTGWKLTINYPKDLDKPGPDTITVKSRKKPPVGRGPVMKLPLEGRRTVKLHLVAGAPADT